MLYLPWPIMQVFLHLFLVFCQEIQVNYNGSKNHDWTPAAANGLWSVKMTQLSVMCLIASFLSLRSQASDWRCLETEATAHLASMYPSGCCSPSCMRSQVSPERGEPGMRRARCLPPCEACCNTPHAFIASPFWGGIKVHTISFLQLQPGTM